MAPIAIPIHEHIQEKDTVQPRKDSLGLPEPARKRLEKAGIDLSAGYPYRPAKPLYLDDVYKIRDYDREHIDPGARADPEKQALFGAAKEVIHLTSHIGTEIVGLQLKDLTDQQKDELGLLIAERSVVFFRDQDLSPQEQKKLGEYYGEIEVHIGGDTLWASGYAAYEKLSPAFRKIIDGREAVYRSAHPYLDRDDPSAGPKHIERVHPIVRVHPATGWKALWVNRAFTDRIVGLDKAESDVILNYLFDVYENNVDIQVRFRWTPGTSALWDNRITIHNASWDYGGIEPRHGTRVTSLAEKPYFKADAPTRRQALGLAGPEDV
ncbi:uncharacterized protein J4E88_001935 [Alternaria novae-zelandiae]|uniref:uncharacterized protein n=1 Tax=Alternaria novae-zelandiae TaxID=430562 RepID=UPI0020C59065|nr:uncharacterized protein J4E88_001935 [Alternaria novae-zelandiae]KAI4693562.1 hypothetical protein J4E88_001935 [Alternaria novae-zelandiae]